MNKFVLALDFDGCITRHPDHFRWLSDHILMSGGEVHVVTGRRAAKDRLETLNLLKGLRIRYTDIHFYPGDYKLPVSAMTQDDFEGIAAWKQCVLDDIGASLFFDDSLHYYNLKFNVPVVHV